MDEFIKNIVEIYEGIIGRIIGAFLNQGPWALKTELYDRYRITPESWKKLGQTKQDEHLDAFCTGRKSKPKTITSSDGLLTLRNYTKASKKPGSKGRRKKTISKGKKKYSTALEEKKEKKKKLCQELALSSECDTNETGESGI